MQSFSTIIFIDLIFILQVCHTAGIRNDCPEDEECVELVKCPDSCEIIKDGSYKYNITSRNMLNSVTCGVKNLIPSVCCDKDKISTIDYCLSCGKTHHPLSNRCTGCEDVHPGDWPWTVILKYPDQDNFSDSILCGGTLVSSKHVITASHCVQDVKPEFVVLGETNITAEYDCLQDFDICGDDPNTEKCFKKGRCADKAVNVKVDSAEIHPGYINNGDVPVNDVAILTLETHVKFSRFIQPLCLPKKPVTETSSKLSISGWGNTVDAKSFNEQMSSQVLQYLDVDQIDLENCSEMLNKNLTESHMCIGTREAGKSACQGDSGGPVSRIVDSFTEQRELVGVISFGSRVCGSPDPTGVTRFDQQTLNWIKTIVPDITVMP